MTVICLLALPAAVFAAGVAGITNAAIIQNIAPTDLQNFISAAADRANQITNGMNTLLTLNQSLQYQVRAAQALAEGSWEGFVEFFDYQTAAVAGYSSSLADLNNVTDMLLPKDRQGLFSSETYKDLKTRAENMSKAMNAANDMVRATDNLVEQSERNARLIQRGVNNASNAGNPLQALQGQAMIFSAIASESQASSRLLGTQLRYLQVLEENRNKNEELGRQRADEFMKPRTGADNPFKRTEASDRIRESLDGRYLGGAGTLHE
jgi:conjugal transfer/entry exclusion protein